MISFVPIHAPLACYPVPHTGYGQRHDVDVGCTRTVAVRAWRRARRDPRQAKFLTVDSLRWVLRNRAYSPWYLVRYWRLMKFRLAHPHIILRGWSSSARTSRSTAAPATGAWRSAGGCTSATATHPLPRGFAANRRQGRVRQAERDQLLPRHRARLGHAGRDWVYICDFDHVIADIKVPIKDQAS